MSSRGTTCRRRLSHNSHSCKVRCGVLQACLIKSKVAIGSDPGFAVRDLHSSDGRVSFTHESTVYTGIIDAGVVPFGVMGDTSTSQLRVGLELKQTAEQKQRYQANNPNGDSCCPRRLDGSSCCSWTCADMMLFWVSLSSGGPVSF